MATFGMGIDGGSEEHLPRIDITQGNVQLWKAIHHVDRLCHDYPKTGKEIQEILKDKESYSVQLMLNGVMHGFAHFSQLDNEIMVHRFSISDDTEARNVTKALWKAVGFGPNPNKKPPKVSLYWPEYALEHWLYSHIINVDGFTMTGMERRMFQGFGSWYDGVLVERQF